MVRRGASGRFTGRHHAISRLVRRAVIIRTTFQGRRRTIVENQTPIRDDHDALGARSEGGARLLMVRRFVCLHPVRRWPDRTGALARARVSQPGAVRAAGAAKASLDPSNGRGLGSISTADRPHGEDDLFAAARTAGLVSQVRTEEVPNVSKSPASANGCANTKSCSIPIACALQTFSRQVIDAVRRRNQRPAAQC